MGLGLLYATGSGGVNSSQSQALLHFIGTVPGGVTEKFVKKMDWLKYLLGNVKEELRERVAAMYGLVAAQLDLPEFEKAVRDLSRSVKEKQLEFQHGATLALGHSFGRRVLLGRAPQPAAKWRLYKETDFICKTWSWKT